MKSNKIFIGLAIVLVHVLIASTCYGLNEETHKSLNEKIAKDIIAQSENDVLAEWLNTTFHKNAEGRKGWDWVAFGGKYEDIPQLTVYAGNIDLLDFNADYIRSINHFHDPLVPDWNDAGFKDIGTSSILWGQHKYQYPEKFSWSDVRGYFRDALTATDENSRSTNFAKTFQGVGMLMHLVQDASVPAHTRDDFHLTFHYESWVELMRTKKEAYFNSFLNPSEISSITIDPSIFNRETGNVNAPAPIAWLIDNNVYDGTNPDVTTGTNVGLAEYANANFFSEDTIFSDEYPYPNLSSTAVMYIDIPDPEDETKVVSRPYYTKARNGDSDFYLLATMGYFTDYVHRNFPPSAVDEWKDYKPALDEYCYDNYARKLLPRAVAYSSALLEYFFRGQIDAVDATTTTGEGGITGVTMKVKNNTPNDAIGGGKLWVAYNYQLPGEAERTYGLSDFAVILWQDSGQEKDDKYEFSFTDPIPANAQDIQYTLVYKGKLGAEEDAVAGKGFEIEPDWTYLYIIQKGFKLGNIGKRYEETSYWLWEDTFANWSFEDGKGYFEWSFDFDLEWAGRIDEIENIQVNLFGYYYSYGFDLDTQDPMHRIEATFPTKSNPTGNLRVYVKYDWDTGVRGIWVRITTKNNEGDTVVYIEPALFSFNLLRRTSYCPDCWWKYKHYPVQNENGTTDNAYSSSITLSDAWVGVNNRYAFSAHYSPGDFSMYNNSSENTCAYHGDYSDTSTRYYRVTYDLYKRDINWCVPPEVLAPLPDYLPYAIATREVKREWDESALQKLGIDKSKLKTWTIPVEYWKVEE